MSHAERIVNATDTILANHLTYLYTTEVIGRELKVVVYDETKEVTHFSISWLPGNVHVVIFHDVVVDPTRRSKGLGDLFHKIRLQIAKEFGATTAICTTRIANSAENDILRKNDWTTVLSPYDGVYLWSKGV